MIVKFEGEVRIDYLESPFIGDEEVINVLKYGKHHEGAPFVDDAKVYVAIANATFDGDLCAMEGDAGWSEWTPGWTAELWIGPHNLINELRRYEGKYIKMWIADEPVNTLEESDAT